MHALGLSCWECSLKIYSVQCVIAYGYRIFTCVRLPWHAGIQVPFQRLGGCRQWPTREGLRENVHESDLGNFLEFSTWRPVKTQAFLRVWKMPFRFDIGQTAYKMQGDVHASTYNSLWLGYIRSQGSMISQQWQKQFNIETHSLWLWQWIVH